MTAVGAPREVTLRAQPLTPEAFAPSGRVVQDERQPLQMQEGQFTARLMTVQRVPPTVGRINRHMDYSQMFVPLRRPHGGGRRPAGRAHGGRSTPGASRVRHGWEDDDHLPPRTWHIEPRGSEKDSCQLINVQTDVFREHTELIDLAGEGITVRLRVD